MRVCYAVSTFPRFDGDQEVPWLLESVKRLRRRGVVVEIFAPSYQGLKSHSVSGVRVHRFRYFLRRWEILTHQEGAPNKIRRSPLFALLGVFYIIFGTLAMVRLCATRRYDLFQAHWPFPHALFAWVGSRLQRSGFALRFYGAELMLADRLPPAKTFIRFFMKKADAVDAISSFTAAKARAIHDRDINIIPYGSPFEIEAGRPAVRRPSPRKQVLFVARLVERKGPEYLVYALPLVRALGIDAHLTIVYSSGDREALVKEAIRQAGVCDFVTMERRVPPDRLAQRYRACDVFVLPAIVDSGGDTEMLGVVFLEAMTYRKPVIGSDVGGIPDVIKDGETGLLVPQKDPAALADAIVRVLSNDDFAARLGEAGYRFSQDCFGWDRITDRLVEEYRSCRQNLERPM